MQLGQVVTNKHGATLVVIGRPEEFTGRVKVRSQATNVTSPFHAEWSEYPADLTLVGQLPV
jgi:hypothetical protein